jgi:hypothetical protein
VFPQFLLFIVYPFWSAIFFSFSSSFLSLLIRALLFFFSADFGTGKPMSRKPRLLLLLLSPLSRFGAVDFRLSARNRGNELFVSYDVHDCLFLLSAFMIHFGVDLVGHDGRRDPLWALDNGWDVFDAFVQPTLRRRRRSIQLVTRIANAQWLYRLPTQGKNIKTIRAQTVGLIYQGTWWKKAKKFMYSKSKFSEIESFLIVKCLSLYGF